MTNESPSANVPRVTLGRIAELAGVSISTVSRALADDPQISVPTREAVRRVADQLGYVPNAAARSLRSRSTRTLGLMLGDLSDPVHGLVAAGFETEARRHGYTVVIATGFGDLTLEREALRVFVEHRNDGVALISTAIDPGEIQAALRPDRLVLVSPEHVGLAEGRGLPERGVVRVDEGTGFEIAVRHLVDLGCRSIGYVGVGLTASNVTRRAAVERAARLAGLPPLRRFTAAADAWRAPGPVAAQIVRDLPDGLICYEDKLALSIMDALRGLGVEVPEDLSLVGFDGIPFAALSRPRLTTIAQPAVEMGRLAAEMLIEAIRTGELRPSVLLPVRFTIGESTRRRGGAALDPGATAGPKVLAGATRDE